MQLTVVFYKFPIFPKFNSIHYINLMKILRRFDPGEPSSD